MKIIFIVPSLKSGGLERVASILSNEWNRQEGCEVVLITLDSKSPFYKLDSDVQLIQASGKVDSGHPLLKLVKKWFWLRGEVKRLNGSVLLTFGERYNAFVIYALRHLNLPIFAGNRTTPLTSLEGVRGKINPKAYRAAKVVFLQTHRSLEILREKYSGVNFKVMPNPIPSSQVSIDYTLKRILNVGSFTGKKNQIALVRIFAELVPFYPDWQLVFVGEGPKLAEVKQEVSKLGIDVNVVFAGLIKDVASFHQEGSIFAFSSLLEGFPNALGEAMRSGMSVIAFDCLTGPSELIRNGENGFLVEQSNHEEYKRLLGELMRDVTLRNRIGRKAKLDTLELDPNSVAIEYINAFEIVCRDIENKVENKGDW